MCSDAPYRRGSLDSPAKYRVFRDLEERLELYDLRPDTRLDLRLMSRPDPRGPGRQVGRTVEVTLAAGESRAVTLP